MLVDLQVFITVMVSGANGQKVPVEYPIKNCDQILDFMNEWKRGDILRINGIHLDLVILDFKSNLIPAGRMFYKEVFYICEFIGRAPQRRSAV